MGPNAFCTELDTAIPVCDKAGIYKRTRYAEKHRGEKFFAPTMSEHLHPMTTVFGRGD
jgi:hypothetical protein